MPIANIPTVMTHGILCHDEAAKLSHHSVAMQVIQDLRDNVQVPGGMKLHQYANLYFDARNPMMFKRQAERASLCVLRVNKSVMATEGTVLSDMNAASKYVRFLAPTQIKYINFDMVFAEDWRHPGDQIAYFRHSAVKCAEVLVPSAVLFSNIQGAYVVSEAAKVSLQQTGFGLDITVNPHLFFA